jgi:diguanylate cyclase (GGDEF)-like protein
MSNTAAKPVLGAVTVGPTDAERAPAATGSLASRLLRSVFGCYFLVAIVVTCAQLGFEYHHAERNLGVHLDAMDRTFGPGIGDAMWGLNEDVLRGIMSGVLQLPDVIGVKIVDDHGDLVYAAGTIRDNFGDIRAIGTRGDALSVVGPDNFVDSLMSREFEIVHIGPAGPRRVLGHWTVYSDRGIIVGQVMDEFVIVLINSVVKTFALWLILHVVIERVIGRPLRQISAFVGRLDINSLGVEPFVLRDRGNHELHLLSGTLNIMTAKLRRSVEDNARLVRGLEEMNATLQERVAERTRELELMARTDRLTGLFNRHKIDEVIEYETNRLARVGGTLAVIICDIDHFKSINDRHGHQAGDGVLVAFAAILRASKRAMDTVARWGGEEFMMICPQTSLAGAGAMAERLRLDVASTDFPVVGRRTCSFGVAEWIPGETAASVLARADAALYRAKTNGRNRVERDDPGTMDATAA